MGGRRGREGIANGILRCGEGSVLGGLALLRRRLVGRLGSDGRNV